MTSKTFCYLPFSHSLIKTNGDVHVCCHYKAQPADKIFNIGKPNDLNEWWNSEQQIKLRQQLLNGEKPLGCSYCHNLEEQGFESLRTRSLQEYKIYKPSIDQPKILSVEADIENICNLKCMMCNESSSSELLKENKALGISNYNQSNFVWSDQLYENFLQLLKSENLRHLNIRAGEPLFNKKIKKLLKEIPEHYLSKTLLHLTSNMTIWNEEWADIFSKFKFVRVMASIDGAGKTYEYIRFPGSWKNTSENLHEIKKLSNVRLILRCSIQNLNIVYLDDFVNWANENNFHIGKGAYGIVSHPEIFSYLNLRPDLTELAIKKLSMIKNRPDMINSLIDNLKKQVFDENNWNKFVSHVKMKDEYRQINIKNYLPDFEIY